MERSCLNCGGELDRRHKSYCSRACRNSHQSKIKTLRYAKVCKVCGKAFRAARPNRQYCSDSCNWKAQSRKRRVRRPKPQQREWEETRKRIYAEQGGRCWLCEQPLDRYQAHHKEHGDHSSVSKDVVVLCISCHSRVHGITVCWNDKGQFTFHGKALELLRSKYEKRNQN